ncbi:unnamed protein product [Linum trigynum]|uniref:Uncharacterized protein n=1 Tax=Linum trigynum TaxID=586398 RepID=A0AAV2FS69_9ROSI
MGLLRVARTNPRISWIKGLRREEFAEAVEAETPVADGVPLFHPYFNPLQFFLGSSSAAPSGDSCVAMDAGFDRIETRMDHEREARRYSLLLQRLCSVVADFDTAHTFWHPLHT